ncbi:synaptobrevin-related protein [Nosema bombycis CQ1]|uniref:Synaptobrevin-related protein n=1 Tax=Nosema bombycis (strain CQ1 / CVCC 102059) TaxID=578461 RepID=R0MDW3_NOSB1|nr:synaptobrevin-related protein [Nosema bombycis CQ1]|eukprot:EOB12270.1 synaptobrevin-related protein [Nosema bombycis CQ1]
MAILYTLIKKHPKNQTLSGEFSPQATNLKIGNTVKKELNDVFNSLPEDSNENFYKFESSNTDFTFMLKVYANFVFAVIVDGYSSERSVLKYFEELFDEFMKIYKDDPRATYYTFDQKISSLSDKFNRENRYKQGLEAVGETKDILAQSLNLIIQRKENIDNLNKLANRMSLEAKQMHSNIKKMHMKSMIQQYGIYGVIIFFILLFLYIIVN